MTSKDIEVLPVSKVLGARIDDAGEQLLLRFGRESGDQFRLGVPGDQVQSLLIAVSHGALELAAKKETAPNARQVMQVGGWDLLQAPDGALVMSVRLPGGGEAAFQLPENARERLLAFAAAMESSMTRPEDASVN